MSQRIVTSRSVPGDSDRAFANRLDQYVRKHRNRVFLFNDALNEAEFFLQVLFAYYELHCHHSFKLIHKRTARFFYYKN